MMQNQKYHLLTPGRCEKPMKIKILLTAVVVLGAMLATAWGADITGKWKGSMDMMGQAMDLGFTFKAAGSTLTGTSVGPQGEEYPISDGKIDGDNISFVVKVTGQMEMKINYKGKISGEEIKLTMQFDMAGMGGGPGAGGPGAGGPGAGGPGGGGPGGGMPSPPELVLKRVK
jgi:hypothetical protein